MVEEARAKKQKMTLDDEASMDKAKSFVTALQELKNLRPQLYSAAEYCEKSYLHSEQKQMLLDSLKDYAVRALVNAIDHLGTAAYKLNGILELQTLDISSIDLKVTCVNQKLLTCQTYADKEGLRQQQLLAIIPRHHKHYILPNTGSRRVHFNPGVQTDPTKPIQARGRVCLLGASAAKTLSWRLASEDESTLKRSVEGKKRMKSTPAARVAIQTLGVMQLNSLEGSKNLTEYKSFENPSEKQIVRRPVRSKSMLSSFLAKQKFSNMKSFGAEAK